MANVFATKTGVWSDTTVWNTGALPTSSDDVYANGFTVTINQNITVLSIRTTSASGIAAGGGFSLSANGLTVTADVTAGTTTCLTITATGTTTYSGSIATTAGGGGILFNSTGIFNGTGTVIGGSGGEGIRNATTGTVNWTGNSTGNASGSGIANVSTGTVSITGNVTGGSVGAGTNNSSTGTITITGSAIGGSGAAGATNSSTGTLRVTRAVGNQSTANTVGVNGANSAGTTVIREAEYGPQGQAPTSGYVRFENSNVCIVQVRREDSTNRVLSDPLNVANLVPAATDVRSGITYNNGTRTGSLVVPSPANVRRGVATDNTTGTADLTAADFWNHLTSNLTTSGSIGERLKNAATIASTGDQIAAALNT